jgi:hypothetical protein
MVHWEQEEELEIVFYETSRTTPAGAPSNGTDRIVFTLHFVLDRARGEYVEKPIDIDLRRTRS